MAHIKTGRHQPVENNKAQCKVFCLFESWGSSIVIFLFCGLVIVQCQNMTLALVCTAETFMGLGSNGAIVIFIPFLPQKHVMLQGSETMFHRYLQKISVRSETFIRVIYNDNLLV